MLEYSTASEALAFLQLHQHNPEKLPQNIFVDLYMPQMTGFEFMEAYNELSLKLKKHCAVYVISSTIYTKDINRVNNDPNVIAFLEKPLDRHFFSEMS